MSFVLGRMTGMAGEENFCQRFSSKARARNRGKVPFCDTMTVAINSLTCAHSSSSVLTRAHVRSRRHFAKLPDQNSRAADQQKACTTAVLHRDSDLTGGVDHATPPSEMLHAACDGPVNV